MPPKSLFLILASVLLTSGAQVLLKLGASAPDLREALATSYLTGLVAFATKPLIIIGLVIFTLAAVLWIVALSQVDLSYAYPFISLGILVTVASGYFVLGETISPTRLGGSLLVVVGVVLVALN